MSAKRKGAIDMIESDKIVLRKKFKDNEGREYNIESGKNEWQIVYCGYSSVDHAKTKEESPEENMKLALEYLKQHGFKIQE